MTNTESQIQFPCHFPIKIIGANSTTFTHEIATIIHKHFPDTPDSAILWQESKKANYLSITVTIYVDRQDILDQLYRELTKHPDIKMVL